MRNKGLSRNLSISLSKGSYSFCGITLDKYVFSFFIISAAALSWQRGSIDESSCRTSFCKENLDCIYLPPHSCAYRNDERESCQVGLSDLVKRSNKSRVE